MLFSFLGIRMCMRNTPSHYLFNKSKFYAVLRSATGLSRQGPSRNAKSCQMDQKNINAATAESKARVVPPFAKPEAADTAISGLGSTRSVSASAPLSTSLSESMLSASLQHLGCHQYSIVYSIISSFMVDD